MSLKCIYFIIGLMATAFGEQNQYEVIAENVTIEYMDNKILAADVDFVTTKDHQTVINAWMMLKRDIPEDMKVGIKGSVWITNGYKQQVLNMKRNLKDVIEMSQFGIEEFCLENVHPPVTWPIEKNVTYRTAGFIPDISKFPPNLPPGKWKIEVTEEFSNKTVILRLSLFCKIKYYK